jgi:hypothetical protein
MLRPRVMPTRSVVSSWTRDAALPPGVLMRSPAEFVAARGSSPSPSREGAATAAEGYQRGLLPGLDEFRAGTARRVTRSRDRHRGDRPGQAPDRHRAAEGPRSHAEVSKRIIESGGRVRVPPGLPPITAPRSR